MTKPIRWFCFRCLANHDVVGGVVKCNAPRQAPLTAEQMRAAVEWAMDHPIEVFEDDA
jgi:hypothetical protein